LRAKRRLAALLVALPLLLAPVAAEGPQAPVRATLARAQKVVSSDASRDDQLTALHALARDFLDTRDMGRRALGGRLATQPVGQQEEFHDLFDEFIVRAYLRRLILFKKPKFGFGAVRENGDAALVKTKILTPNDEFYVDYEMRRRDGRWLATDIVVEGISLRDNYGEQFASLLRERSFAELLDLMRRKLRIIEDRDES
jgi:phospholipid transport system substrate-binding protein